MPRVCLSLPLVTASPPLPPDGRLAHWRLAVISDGGSLLTVRDHNLLASLLSDTVLRACHTAKVVGVGSAAWGRDLLHIKLAAIDLQLNAHETREKGKINHPHKTLLAVHFGPQARGKNQ